MSALAKELATIQSQPIVDLGIPSVDQCLRMLADHGVRPNIREHSQKVRMLAVMIVTALRPEASIDGGVVSAGALLHDITKTRSLTTHEQHDKTGAELVKQLGYPRIASIVAQHVNLTSFDPNSQLTPEELICYADKRVLHTEIVSLMQRKIDVFKRYGNGAGVEASFAVYAELEKKVRRWLSCSLEAIIPDDTVDVLFRWDYAGSNVKIAGDFTCWIQVPMQDREIHFRLPPGTYSFKFVVDGAWMFDMRKPTIRDSDGNTNNLVTVIT